MNARQLIFGLLCGLAGCLQAWCSNHNNINDAEDDLLAYAMSGSVEVSSWQVSEPYITVWVHSQPMVYSTSEGLFGFGIANPRRSARRGYWSSTGVNHPHVFGLGTSWECSWLTYVDYTLSGTNITSSTTWLPGGGSRKYVLDGATADFKSRTTMKTLRDGGNNVIGFQLDKPTGGKDIYGYLFNLSASTNYAFVTEQFDPAGRRTQFQYTTITNIFGAHSLPTVQLLRVIDPDNRTNTLAYHSVYKTHIISVTNPNGHKAQFGYDLGGELMTVTNMASMVDTFYYDGYEHLTSFETAYGSTSFTLYTNSYDGFHFGGTNRINRAVRVVDDTGSELFMYRDLSSKLSPSSSVDLLPSSYPTNQVPVTSPLTNTFDNSYMDTRNTFHWGKREYEMITTNYTIYDDIYSLTTNDYNLATIKHWLRSTNANPPNVTDRLSMVWNGSPDGTNAGAKVWYDYQGKNGSQPWLKGTNGIASYEAAVLPDGTSRIKYAEQNQWGLPTKITTSYTSGTNVAQRSLTFTYAANDIDLLTVKGPSNELLSSNAYNSAHQVVTNYNAVNDMALFFYDASNRLCGAKSPMGLTTTNYFYTTGSHAGWLQKTIELELARTNTFGYTNGAVAAHTNALELVTTYKRDALNRVLELVTTAYKITNTYENLALSTTANALGETNRICYDSFGRMCESINALNNTNSVSYCGCGAIHSITNALGGTTTFDYNYNGQQTAALLPDAQTSLRWNHDLLGQVTNTIVVGLATNFMSYNNQGLLSLSSNHLGVLESYQYDIFDRVTNSVDANGLVVTNTYDALGRVRTVAYPDGGVESFGYSAAGVIAHTNQLGKVTTYGYDAAGRMIAMTNANGEVERSIYDCEGRVLQLIDGKNQTNAFTYDTYGRLLRHTNGLGHVVLTNAYNDAGRLIVRWTPNGGPTLFDYDKGGNLTNVNYPTNMVDVRLKYDALGQMTNMVDVLGTTTFTYNELGELESEDGPWAMDTIAYLNTNGLRGLMTLEQPNQALWKLTYTYDSLGRLTNLLSPAGAFGYVYQSLDAANPKGNLLQKITQPNGSYVTNSFNNMGQILSTVLKSSSNTVLNSHAYVYNTGGQRTKQTRTGGDYVDYGYDNIGQLTSALGKEFGGTQRLNEKFGYGYDAAHNLLYRTNNALKHTFSMTAANTIGQIARSGTFTAAGFTTATPTNVTVNSQAAAIYSDNTFAKEGLTLTDGTNTFTAVAQDALGRSASATNSVYLPAVVGLSYNTNGNLIFEGYRGYSYKDDDTLNSAWQHEKWSVVFTYDGLKRLRVKKTYLWNGSSYVLSEERRYLYDGKLIIQERNGDNIPLVTYTRGIDMSGGIDGAGGIGGLLARTDNTQLVVGNPYAHTFFHADGNGNVTHLTDTAQRLAAHYTYDPFGRIIADTGPSSTGNRGQFSSKETDPSSSLSYFGARFYNPNIGRWNNADPAGFADGMNMYAFVRNRPTILYDPFGFQPEGTSLPVSKDKDLSIEWNPTYPGLWEEQALGKTEADFFFIQPDGTFAPKLRISMWWLNKKAYDHELLHLKDAQRIFKQFKKDINAILPRLSSEDPLISGCFGNLAASIQSHANAEYHIDSLGRHIEQRIAAGYDEKVDPLLIFWMGDYNAQKIGLKRSKKERILNLAMCLGLTQTESSFAPMP